MSQVLPSSMLLVGKVIRPHGWRGLVRIWSYARSEDSFMDAGTVFLKSSSGQFHEFGVISARPHKNMLLMRLEGINSKEDAEEYRGSEIFIRKESIAREEGEFFWHELLGLKVFLENGDYLGDFYQVIETGSNDIYVVRDGEKEYLIPATYEFVRDIDLVNGKVIISDREGLLDLNEV